MEQASVKNIWAIDPVHTRIRFDAKYLLISTVSGWFQELEGSVTNSQADFSDSEISLTLYTNSIYTGIEERDNHLRSADFFQTDKYPTIHFRSTKVSVEDDHINITGKLTIKDQTHEISFQSKLLGMVPDPMGNTKAGFELDMVFDRREFDIGWNLTFDKHGILIADQVHLHADIQLLKLS